MTLSNRLHHARMADLRMSDDDIRRELRQMLENHRRDMREQLGDTERLMRAQAADLSPVERVKLDATIAAMQAKRREADALYAQFFEFIERR